VGECLTVGRRWVVGGIWWVVSGWVVAEGVGGAQVVHALFALLLLLPSRGIFFLFPSFLALKLL